MIKLQTLSGPSGTPSFEPTGTFISIGRARDNTVHLNHPSVSKHHAIIIIEDDVPRLFDLHSTNGTYVNRQKAGTIPLKQNDEIFLGEFVLRFETDMAALPPPVPAPAPRPVQETIAPPVFKKLAVDSPRTTTDSIKPQSAPPPPPPATPPAGERSYIRLPSTPTEPKPGLVQKLLKRETGGVRPPPPLPALEPAPAPVAPPAKEQIQTPPAIEETPKEGGQLFKKPSGAVGDKLLVKPGSAPSDRLIKKPATPPPPK